MSRELLEKAANAAGIATDGRVFDDARGFWMPPDRWWNPLTDDGDAFRLAVKLDLCVGRSVYGDSWCASHNSLVRIIYESGSDPYAATRLAIVRTAAAMGEKP